MNEVLRSCRTEPWPEVRTRLNRPLYGWTAYSRYGSLWRADQAIIHHVAARVRLFLRRRHKVPIGGTHVFPDYVIFGSLGMLSLRPVPPVARA